MLGQVASYLHPYLEQLDHVKYLGTYKIDITESILKIVKLELAIEPNAFVDETSAVKPDQDDSEKKSGFIEMVEDGIGCNDVSSNPLAY